MPELPLVERSRREALRYLRGLRVARVAVRPDPVMMPHLSPRQLVAALAGTRVRGVGRRGKYLWLELDRRPWVVLHFGMTGSFQYPAADEPRPLHWRLDLEFQGGRRLILDDPRRFGRVFLVQDPLRDPPVSKLGYDPLLDRIPVADFMARLCARRAPVKAVLLDQSFAAGVGNWIADEILYQSRIRPQRRGDQLTEREARLILRQTVEVVRAAVQANNEDARFPRGWLFHRRWGDDPQARTRQGHPILRETVGGRTTAWVPAVQK